MFEKLAKLEKIKSIFSKKKNKYIIFEGIDGSGKTTQLNKLLIYLNKDSMVQTLKRNEPTYSNLGKEIRSILAGNYTETFNNYPENIKKQYLEELFILDRIHNIYDTDGIIERLKEYNIIQDRSFLSNIAYQSYTDEDIHRLKEANKNMLKPDLVFYLDIDIEIAFERLNKRNTTKDNFETKSELTRIKNNYEKILNDSELNIPIIKIDANQNQDEVFESIVKELEVLP